MGELFKKIFDYKVIGGKFSNWNVIELNELIMLQVVSLVVTAIVMVLFSLIFGFSWFATFVIYLVVFNTTAVSFVKTEM